MKISLQHLLSFIQPGVSLDTLSSLLTNSGLEVEGLSQYSAVKGGLQGLITGEVISCEQHPNADKLRCTTVDIGEERLLSIVCGAPNVAQGQKVVVAPVGCTIYPTKGEPFTIGKAKIRGELSEGMLCAEDEIGVGESHDGIMVLKEETAIGQPVATVLGIPSDTVIEIGLTANRGDAASHLGVARELSALLSIPFDYPITPSVAYPQTTPYQIKVEDPETCPRYAALLLEDVEIQTSPAWLQHFLLALGIQPKNNVVDVTNYVLHSIGQPLHAFDAAKIQGKTIQIKTATKDEVFVSLDGEERKLKGEELMVWDEVSPIAMAGVIGGAHSAVSPSTKQVLLESAYFEPGIVRKAAKRHALSTDASFRFERGTNPEMVRFGLGLAAHLLLEMGAAKVASAIIESTNEACLPQRKTITLRKQSIQRVCGIEIPENKVLSILGALGIQLLSQDEKAWELSVPAFKSDVTREIDLIEEVIRIYGFDNIPLETTLRISLPSSGTPADKAIALKQKIANYLRAQGFHEMQSNSMVKDKYFSIEEESVVALLNPLSSEMSVMRQSLVPGVLESIAYNQKRKAESVLLFEFGKIYSKKGPMQYSESNILCIGAWGRQTKESWESKSGAVDYFFIKKQLKALALLLGLDEISVQNGLMMQGEAKEEWIKIADVRKGAFFAEINLDVLFKKTRKVSYSFKELPKFPVVRRDLSLVLDKSVTFESLKEMAKATAKNYLQEMQVFSVFEGKPLEETQKSYALAFYLYDAEKTMEDKQIEQIMEKLMKVFETKAGASIRRG